MRLSVLVSAFNRAATLPRLFNSVLCTQNHDDIELVLINDCSPDNTDEIVEPYLEKFENVKYFKNEVRSERVISYKRALEESTGDWIIHIGSDDILFPRFAEFLFKWVDKYPESKLFNFGRAAVNKHNDRITCAPGQAFQMGQAFNSGLIAAGQFSWHKSISKEIDFPVVRDCYAFADASKIPITGMIKDGEQQYYSRFTRTLGNPWGEDFYMFWRLTRKNVSTHIPIIGIIINVR